MHKFLRDDPKLRAVHIFPAGMVKARDHLSLGDADASSEAGYTKAKIFDILLGTGLKTLSNYTNSISHKQLDAPLKGTHWTPQYATPFKVA